MQFSSVHVENLTNSEETYNDLGPVFADFERRYFLHPHMVISVVKGTPKTCELNLFSPVHPERAPGHPIRTLGLG